MTSVATRKRLGIFYTPDFVADFIVKQALEPLIHGKSRAKIDDLRILDPACGDGVFLDAAARYCRSRAISPRLFGIDVDPKAVAACRQRLGNRAEISRRDALTLVNTDQFDLVVGNPPYVRIQNQASSRARHFASATGKYDLSVLFVELGLRLLKPGGRLGFILPNKFLTADYGRGIRSLIARENSLAGLVNFGHAQIFPDASTYTCLLFLQKSSSQCFWEEFPPDQNPQSYLADFAPTILTRPRTLTSHPWTGFDKLLDRLLSDRCPKLGDVAERIFQGVISGADRLLYLPWEEAKSRGIEERILRPILKGPQVRKNRIEPAKFAAIFPYELRDGTTRLIEEQRLRREFPAAYAYLSQIKSRLLSRGSASMQYPAWFAYWCPRDLRLMQRPKILTQVLARGNKFAFDSHGKNLFVGGGNAGVYGIVLKPDSDITYGSLLDILNSPVSEYIIRRISSQFRGGYFSYARRFIEQLPVCPIDLTRAELKVVNETIQR